MHRNNLYIYTMRQEETIDFQIRGAWAKISRMYNVEAGKFGGTMSMGYILLNIDKDGSPSTRKNGGDWIDQESAGFYG